MYIIFESSHNTNSHANKNSTYIKMSTTPITNYIVTTGDIREFDGFLALPIYQKKALEMGQTAMLFL